jgi:salicylate hydroxylase
MTMQTAVKTGGRDMQTGQLFVGEGSHSLIFLIANGKLLNIVAFKNARGAPWTQKLWVIASSRGDLLNFFKSWRDSLRSVLELIEKPEKWAMFDHPPARHMRKETFAWQ